jgi:hypothetical protein
MIKPKILTRPTSGIFTDDFLYLIAKSDESEGRLEELKMLESSAREKFEIEAGIFIGDHTFRAELDNFWDSSFEYSPIRSTGFVIKVTLEGASTESILNTNCYKVEFDVRTKIKFIPKNLPKIAKDSKIVIEGTLGHTLETMPKTIKHAIIMFITYYFDLPENHVKRHDTAFDTVIDNHRQGWV